MPTRRQLIQKITLNADASSVTFSNIPQNYTDLRIVASTRSSQSAAATNMRMTFNGSSSGYSERVLYGDSVGAASYANTSASLFTIGLASAATSTANTFGYIEINIPNYTSSNNKSLISKYVSENNSATQNTAYVGQLAGLWTNTSAISSITFTLASGNYVANSTFYLYGITHVPIIRGGEVTVPGDGFKYHAFRSSGSLQVIEPGDVEYLVVAGGGGGGGGSGGGGGAGGLRYGRVRTSQGISSITIGAGGGGAAAGSTKGTSGSNSSGLSISTTGGGGGGSHPEPFDIGVNGGSGGGGGSGANAGMKSGGSGVSGEGFAGGQGGTDAAIWRGGGGGGGSSAAGSNATSAGTNGTGGAGGAGTTVFGIAYAGGGGGGGDVGSGLGAARGGNGGTGSPLVDGSSAIANSGSGGGGRRGSGASGIVIIRYPYDGN